MSFAFAQPSSFALEPSGTRRYLEALHGNGADMSDEAKTLIERARALPPRDRIALVEDVLDSLDRADPEIDRLWTREAKHRLAAYRRGELAAKDLSDIVAKYRP